MLKFFENLVVFFPHLCLMQCLTTCFKKRFYGIFKVSFWSNNIETTTIKRSYKSLTIKAICCFRSVRFFPTVPFSQVDSWMKLGVYCSRASKKWPSRFKVKGLKAIKFNAANSWKRERGRRRRRQPYVFNYTHNNYTHKTLKAYKTKKRSIFFHV